MHPISTDLRVKWPMASIVGTQQDATNNSLVNLPTGDYFPFFLDHLAHFSSRPILTPVFRSVIPFNWRIQPWIQMNLKEGEKRLEQCMQIVIGLVNRYSRRTSVLINRLPYNDSSREQHNNEIYAGEIYGVITVREKREGGREKKWLTYFPTRRGIKMPLRSILSSAIFTFCCLPAVPCSRDFSFQPWDKRLIRSPRCFHAREKYIFPSPRQVIVLQISIFSISPLGNFI